MIKQALNLSAGNLVSRCAFAFLTIGLAKLVSPAHYGAFSYAIAVTNVSSYLCELGIQKTYLREMARRTPLWADYSLTSLQLRGLLFVVVCGGGYLAFPRLGLSESGLRCLQWMFAPGVLGLTLTNWISGALLSRSKFGLLSMTRIRAAVVQVAIVGCGVWLSASDEQRIQVLALCYGLGLLVGGCLGLRSLGLRKKWIRPKRFIRLSGRLLTGLQGYAFSGFLSMLAPALGVLVLERSAPLAVVGTFALAVRVPQFLYTVPGAAAQTFYPALFREARTRNWAAYDAIFRKESVLLLIVGFAMAIVVLASAPLVSMVVGHSMDPGYQATLRQALHTGAGVVFVQSLSTPLGHALETMGKTGSRTAGQCCAVLVAILAYSLLGERYGVVGAMAAAVCTELTLYFSWLALALTRAKPVNAGKLVLPGIAGGVLIALAVVALRHFHG